MLSGRYRVQGIIGEGAMAEVFAAEDVRLGRDVALKMLKAQLSADLTLRRRFEQEARTAAKLSHPNVVGILDTGEEQGLAYIVMERLPGTTLADELKDGPLPEERVREVAHQVLAALGAAHSLGIVHRDIKPANLLTGGGGGIKVADFGIATAINEAQALTATGLLIGTPAYLAPERLAGAPASAQADLYSLAAVLYECLTGRKPFEGPGTIELMSAVMHQEPEPVARLRPGVDRTLAQVVERTLSKDPAGRPRSAEEMARELDARDATDTLEIAADPDKTRVMTEQTAVLVQEERPAPLAPARPSVLARHRALAAFVVALAVALGVGLSVSSLSGPPSNPAPSYPSVAKVPHPLAHALKGLEKAVG